MKSQKFRRFAISVFRKFVRILHSLFIWVKHPVWHLYSIVLCSSHKEILRGEFFHPKSLYFLTNLFLSINMKPYKYELKTSFFINKLNPTCNQEKMLVSSFILQKPYCKNWQFCNNLLLKFCPGNLVTTKKLRTLSQHLFPSPLNAC